MNTVAEPATVLFGQFAAGDVEVDGGVVLDRTFHLQVGPQRTHPLGGRTHLVDVGAARPMRPWSS